MAAWLLVVGSAHAGALVSSIVSDPLTGVAIDGYDPVSYFLGPEPQEGRPDYEYAWQGVPWYFASAANRDVFMRNPGVYAPQFGGHCLMSLSRGYLSDGKPRLYVLDAQKLYLFYSVANRDAFLLSKAAALKSAAENWTVLSASLAGPQDAVPVAASLNPAAEPDIAADAGAGHLQPN